LCHKELGSWLEAELLLDFCLFRKGSHVFTTTFNLSIDPREHYLLLLEKTLLIIFCDAKLLPFKQLSFFVVKARSIRVLQRGWYFGCLAV
jgi:hypothetical protein